MEDATERRKEVEAGLDVGPSARTREELTGGELTDVQHR